MKPPIIADSSALVSLATNTDSNYHKAVDIAQTIKDEDREVVVPGDVFSETLNVLGRKAGHQIAIGTAETIINSNNFIIAETTAKIREGALEIFRNQTQSVSFTDCLVMAFADHYHTKTIFGFDEVFRKNKYQYHL
ncbi:MAG TPA: PIN domain-containing protein [Patescibacteria group bacterium]|nr:PIN domain-containing protein [Patescibacteria group bacterium]